MGELMVVDADGRQVAVVGGGAPMKDWSQGLNPQKKVAYSPGQQRPIMGDAKNRAHRVSGLATKFDLTGNLRKFERGVRQQLQDYGLDTIAHLPDPVTKEPVCVVTNHPRFNVESAKLMVKDQVSKYDKYDRANDAEAKLFLENSLEESVAERVMSKVSDEDTFPVMFMQLIYLLQNQSLHRFEVIKDRIAKRKPAQYPGQDIALMAQDNKNDAKELATAGQYDHNLTSRMVDNFLEGGGRDHNLYRHNMMELSQRLEKELLKVGYMDKAAATFHLAQEQLTADDVCDYAERSYRKLKDKQQWEPARNIIRDSKRPSPSFNNAMTCITREELDVQINALVQRKLSGLQPTRKPTDKCNKCGGLGHWARDPSCPQSNNNNKKKGDRRNNNRNRNNNSGRGDRDSRGRPSDRSSWRRTPPASGQPQTKSVHGKDFHWCSHCNRWSTSHGTDGHTGPKRESGETQVNHLFVCPEAWHVPSLEPPLAPTLTALWNVLAFLLTQAMNSPSLLIIVCSIAFWSGIHWEALSSALLSTTFTCFSGVSAYLSAGIGGLSTVGSAVLSAFSSGSRFALVAPLLWLVLLVFVTLPVQFQHELLGYKAKQEFRPFNMTRNKFKRYIRHCRRKRRPTSFSNHRHTRHYGLATRTRRPQSNRVAEDLYELTCRIGVFDDIRRSARREGGNGLYHRHGLNRERRNGLNHRHRNKRSKRKCYWTRNEDSGDWNRHDPSDEYWKQDWTRNENKGSWNRRDPSDEYWKQDERYGYWKQNERTGVWKMHFDSNYREIPSRQPRNHFTFPDPAAVGYEKRRRQRMRNRRPRYYRPTVGNGIPMSQLELLASPIAAAFFTNGDVPPHLNYLMDKFKNGQDPKKAMAEFQEKNKVRKNKVIWDSGASHSLSCSKNDFVGPIKPAPIGLKIKGIARGLEIKGVGNVAWSVIDTTGMLRTLKVPAYYVPSAHIRLLSIPSLLQTYPQERITMKANSLTLVGTKDISAQDGSSNDGQLTNSIHVTLDPRSNLPSSLAYEHGTTSTNFEAEFNNFVSTTTSSNHNLSPASKELLKWHHRLGHLNYKQIQFLLRTGVLAHSESSRRLQAAASKLTTVPLCAACQFGKQRRRPAPGKTQRVVRDREGALKKENLFPGQKVSVDHFACSTKGRLLHTFGKEPDSERYSGGAIFVDHATGYVYVHNQVHINTHETLEGKLAFEGHCKDFGVVVSEYQSDNGRIFTSARYVEHLRKFEQVSSFAGVGAHHHNGIAERSIQTIMSIARTMMMHQAIHWPEVSTANCWPLAVHHAVHLYNHMPSAASGLSPHDLMSRTRWPQSQLTDVHVWGCPVYVLDKKIHDGNKLPRWKPRSTRQIYVGMSQKHASSVPLCLNPTTGAVTSQFHIVFDDEFSTIATSVDDLPDFGSAQWDQMFGESTYQYMMDDDDLAASQPDEPGSIDGATKFPSDLPPLEARVRFNVETHRPSQPLEVTPPPTTTVGSTVDKLQRESQLQRESPLQREIQNDAPQAPPQREMKTTTTPPQPLTAPTSVTPTPIPISLPAQPPQPPHKSPKQPPPLPTRRSRRTTAGKAPERLVESQSYFAAYFNTFNTEWTEPTKNLFSAPAAYKVRATKDPDTLSYHEAMNSSNKDKWCEAAKKEIEELEGKLTWVEVPMSEAKSKIIPGTWVFRVKRNPSGEIKKYKARYCMRGDLEELDPTEDTYAPTVAWSTVRMFLVLCMILGWTTVSVDFSNAFVQSKLPSPKWMHLPRGFGSTRGPGTCLRLVKSLYGGRSSPNLWSKTAKEGLEKCGLKQSKYDPCLFYKPGMIVVLYVDDAGIGAKDPADIDDLIEKLRELKFELKKEGNFNEFLGIKFDKRKDGSIELTQTGLIDKILATAGMTDCNPNRVPATGPLGTDPDGEPMDESWNYRSIVGMLLYLSTNSRPDISFAVSQVARFCANPKASHATAVKTILRYLKRTRDKGMIIKIDKKLTLDLFVDADFCGLFKVEPDVDSNSVRSRSGFIVKLAGCPLTWRSSLQTSIACSTLEAEYTALSDSLKTLIPLKRLLIEACAEVDLPDPIKATIRARAFEDNQGCYYLATNQRITSRTRWYLNKFHWFWQFVSKNGITGDTVAVEEIDTSLQDADYFTKALSPEPFEANRFRVQGW